MDWLRKKIVRIMVVLLVLISHLAMFFFLKFGEEQRTLYSFAVEKIRVTTLSSSGKRSTSFVKESHRDQATLIANENGVSTEPRDSNSTSNSAITDSAQADDLDKIYAQIESVKFYPVLAKRLKQEGVVTISFKLHQDGTVSELRVLQSSGFKLLDQAALEIMNRIGRFNLTWNIDREIKLPVSYRLN